MKKCENCNKEHNGDYGSGRFCSKFCSHSYASNTNRIETNKKVSETMKNKELNHPKKVEIICNNCNDIFIRNWNKRNSKFCSRRCCTIYNNKTLNLASIAGLKSAKSQNRRSKNEIYFYNLCKDIFDDVLHNEPLFNGWDADVIIRSIKIAILWNGIWHYKQIKKDSSLIQIQNRDNIKINEIIKCGFKPYVIKDLGKYDEFFVKKEFEKFKIYCGMV